MDLTEFGRAVAAEDQPGAVFAALERLTEATIGVRLFTIMTLDPVTGEAERIYSNRPAEYPVSGRKGAPHPDWAAQVLERRQLFVANDYAGVAHVFFDHELIRSLGCESVVNIPVVVAGRVMGAVNCLHGAGHYTPERQALAEQLRVPGALAFLIAERAKGGAA